MPKQYLQFNGKELIAFTLGVFQKSELIDNIVVAARPEYFDLLDDIKENYGISKLNKIIEGGKERQDSVFNALSSLNSSADDLIIIHDAARPLLPVALLDSAIEMARNSDALVVAVKARDTLLQGDEFVEKYLDRQKVFYVQTPQIFRYDILWKAMNSAQKDLFYGTDESMLVERIGKKVKILEGSSLNFKVTTSDDIELFKLLLKE